MIKKFKDRFFVLSAIAVLAMLVISIQLFRLQIVEKKKYTAQSESKLSSSEVISAPRGKILDRYGRPIVTNRLGFSVSFTNPNLSDDELNDLILNTVMLFKKNEDEYLDNFPIEYDGENYIFAYEGLEGDALETKVRNCKFAMGISDNLDAKGCIDELKVKFGLDNRYTPQEIRDIIAVRYEMIIRNFSNSTPFNFSADVSMKTVSAIEENDEIYSGIKFSSAPVRDYVNGSMAAHLLGRVDIIYQEEYEKLKDEGYDFNSVIGKDGIEKVLEKKIKGTSGSMSIQRSVGEEEKYIENAAIPGNNAMLTIDIDLQKIAEDALRETIEDIKKKSKESDKPDGSDVGGGSVVVQDIHTGEILAMANYPTFNPETFNKDFDTLKSDTTNPLLNRAISGMYPPGSVFKMLTTIAALEEGIIDTTTTIEDKGQYEYYDQVFNCWIFTETGQTHGHVDASNAIKNSCNYYYYEVGKRLGVDKLVEYAEKIRLGKKTGIEIEGESTGILASQEYKEKNIGEIWYPGDTLQMAIGQSYNLFTPIQLANYTATIANGGKIYKTHLLKCIRDYDSGEIIEETPIEQTGNIEMSDDTYNAVTYGMRLVSYDGTAGSIFGDFPIETCSKTGSSQVNGGSANGVFVSYAPYNDPQIAISIVIENAGSGSSTAPIAKAIYSEYFKLNQKDSKDSHVQNNVLLG